MRVNLASTVLAVLALQITISAGDRFLWEHQEDIAGGTDGARAVTIKGQTAVVAGTTFGQASSDFVVRAYYVPTGALLWKRSTPVASGINMSVFVTSAGNKVFAAGYEDQPTCCGSDIFVRAYNAKTGNLRWDSALDKGLDDFPQGIAATISAVVVVGYGGNRPGTGEAVNFLVRAYDPRTGAVLWEDQLDHGPLATDIAWNVAIDGDRVFVSGETDKSTPGQSNLVVRAYDIATGFLIWQAERPDTSTHAIAVGNGRVFVAGVTSNFANAFLGAFDAVSGNLLWSNTASLGVFLDVAFRNGHVVATGWRDFRSSLVRTYAADTGDLEWEAAQAPVSGSEFFRSVGLNDTTAYVAGSHVPSINNSDVLVRGYNLLTGAMTFEDRRGSGDVLDMAVSGRRVVAVGRTVTPTPFVPSDFLVRTYRFAAAPRILNSED